jgi:hypothetical protein
MKRSLLIACCAVFCASVASAQIPNVAVYFDEGLQFQQANCPADPIGTVAQELYVVANNFGIWMSGIEYQIFYPTQLFVAGDFPIAGALSIGSSASGIGITFPIPLNAFTQAVVQTVNVVWMCNDCDPTNQDAPIVVMPYPGQPWVRGVEWPNLNIVIAFGMTSLICSTTPVQETTWGGVKALYQ